MRLNMDPDASRKYVRKRIDKIPLTRRAVVHPTRSNGPRPSVVIWIRGIVESGLVALPTPASRARLVAVAWISLTGSIVRSLSSTCRMVAGARRSHSVAGADNTTITAAISERAPNTISAAATGSATQ